MIINKENREVNTQASESKEFVIKANSKAFKILIDGLYSNKFNSITREIWCNALDSHKSAGCPEKPFMVTIPSLFNREFRVRDYGTGLKHDDVMNLYSTIFESTKEDSNDDIGCLGLGSKSPFSYTDTYSVTSWYDGFKRYYSAVVNSAGVPTINLMHMEETDEPNGLEVSFPVDTNDVEKFAKAAKEISIGFDVKPICKALDSDWPVLENRIEGKGYRITNSLKSMVGYNSLLAVKMGPVIYPVKDTNYINNGSFIRSIMHYGDTLIIDVDMGDVSFVASREELSFGKDEPTEKTIQKRLSEIESELLNDVVKQINKASCLFEANKIFNGLPYIIRSRFVAEFPKSITKTKTPTSLIKTKWGDDLNRSAFLFCGEDKELNQVSKPHLYNGVNARIQCSTTFTNSADSSSEYSYKNKDGNVIFFVYAGESSSKKYNNKHANRRINTKLKEFGVERAMLLHEDENNSGKATIEKAKEYFGKNLEVVYVHDLPAFSTSKKAKDRIIKAGRIDAYGNVRPNCISLDSKEVEKGGIYIRTFRSEIVGEYSRKLVKSGHNWKNNFPDLEDKVIITIPKSLEKEFSKISGWVELESILSKKWSKQAKQVAIQSSINQQIKTLESAKDGFLSYKIKDDKAYEYLIQARLDRLRASFDKDTYNKISFIKAARINCDSIKKTSELRNMYRNHIDTQYPLHKRFDYSVNQSHFDHYIKLENFYRENHKK